jgi:hypothetical protein
MANKKGEMTILDGFRKARETFEKLGDADMVAFFDKRIALEEKHKNAPKKLTPAQEANEVIKRGILENMEVGVKYTIGDMLIGFDCFDEKTTPQKVSALLSQLGAKGTGEIVRTEEKGKAYFSLA